jgi:predicted deacylase
VTSPQAPSTLILTDVDYERDGIQHGNLMVPYSSNRSAYGRIPIPIMVAKRGDGPTVLLTGANHGDEYEGPLTLMALARTLDVNRLNGRLIIVPALNMPAYRAGTRVSPIDQVNLNRTFPGNRNGTPTEMIAHYVESVLMPLADYGFDCHSGGSSLAYLPTLFALRREDPGEVAEIERLIAAFNPPRALFMNLLGEDRIISAAARRHGVIFMTGEFGSGGSVDLEGLAVLKEGIAGMLDAVGVLPRSGPAPAKRTVRRMAVNNAEHFLFAPCAGVFEPKFKLGDEVTAGQVAGLIHDQTVPWREGVPVVFKASGLALCIRTYALVEPGDCLGHLGVDV